MFKEPPLDPPEDLFGDWCDETDNDPEDPAAWAEFSVGREKPDEPPIEWEDAM